MKCIRSNSSREPLVKAAQLRVDKTLKDKALAKCDHKILAAVSRDIVAAEAYYHRSCYRQYTRHERPSSSSSPTDEVQDDAEEKAFSDLFKYIRLEVIGEKSVVTMTELTSRLGVLAQARGKEKLSEATRKHIRRKIEAEFGSILLIFPDDKGKLIVVPDNLSVADIVEMNLAMKKDHDILKHRSSHIDKIVDQSSTYIRKAILDMTWKSPCPIHPSDVDVRCFPVPESLKRVTADVSNPSRRIVNLVCPFSQDIVYAVTCGKTKPPKQVILSYGVKTLTMTGHGISWYIIPPA